MEHFIDSDGQMQQRPAGGGVAVALGSAALENDLTWLASCASPADLLATSRLTYFRCGDRSRVRLLRIDEAVYQAFYSSFANPLLWFIQHGLGSCLDNASRNAATRSWSQGYVPVNRIFASAVIGELDRSGSNEVMLHDYHLYLCARMIRSQRPDVSLLHFTHIPWPEPSAWDVLPSTIVAEICRGLLGNDSVVFQTIESVDNFLDTCRAYLHDEASVCSRQATVRYEGRTTRVWANPISINVDELKGLRTDPDVSFWSHIPMHSPDVKLIVRVDRLDPSKNVLRGFEAFESLLEHNSALRGKVKFIAYLVPTRESLPAYRDYSNEVYKRVDLINRRFRTADWLPIQVITGNDRPRALAGLRQYDVLLVNSLADGMNLVAKEGVTINERDGAVVLSRTAGAYLELAGGALGVDPNDVAGTEQALRQAIQMTPAERSSRARRLQEAVESHQLRDWFRALHKDLEVTNYVRRACPYTSASVGFESVPA